VLSWLSEFCRLRFAAALSALCARKRVFQCVHHDEGNRRFFVYIRRFFVYIAFNLIKILIKNLPVV